MYILSSNGYYHFYVLLTIIFYVIELAKSDIGTASRYSPPYSPTTCFGNDPTQFPSSNLFAAAGSGIWDNGASCGRQYLVKCISGSIEEACVPLDGPIQIRIVEFAENIVSEASSPIASIILSNAAFQTIANMSISVINIEFLQ
ncbi:hypothetical protein LIER_42119 [Lithospermum erythrorhizon]|uniref:Expansin-like EG45 domain-containing protein n=1 Tax=Lithospermum erythrorhizon TaxID=34254 RepID=A0AAV3RNB6_LITER